jgi:hypothetical protein
MIRPLIVASLALGVLVACGSADDDGRSSRDEATSVEVTTGEATSGESTSGEATAGEAPAADRADVGAVPVAGGANAADAEVAADVRRDTGVAEVAGPAAVELARTALRRAPQYDGVVATPYPSWVDASTCPDVGRTAVVDRAHQWGWLCGDGRVTRDFPITSARSQPDPGAYDVYAKDLLASSTISGAYSEMTHFVAFTHGEYQGARIAFHSVPTYGDGSYVQPLDSVGSPELFGASAGCIRVLPDDAVAIWDWLAMGDTVTVVS